MLRIGFLINPIAGMGGRVGLKGTDGVLEEAIKRGAKPIAKKRAEIFLNSLRCNDVLFLTPKGEMGEDSLRKYNFPIKVIYNPRKPTTVEDTKNACREFLRRGVDLIVFAGGDGTARDVVSVVGDKVPILGIPTGVKMYSSVFCVTPEKCARVVESLLSGVAKIADGEVLDIDEDSYRRNELKIRLYGFAKVPVIEDFIQSSKTEYGLEDEEDKEAIAEYFVETMDRETLYIMGAGTTTAKIAEKMGIKKTLLGVDAIYDGKLVARDLSERDILLLLEKYRKVKIVVTPIGSQGFVFGRGNQQISERVLCKVGKKNIIIVATPRKINELRKLRMDVENCESLRGYYRILIGYGRYRMMKME